jgi:hypothetical protein
MLEPSEYIYRVESAGWLLFVLEISEDLGFGRPPPELYSTDYKAG